MRSFAVPGPPDPSVALHLDAPPPIPVRVVVAGVLGLVSAVLALLTGSFVVLAWWSVEGDLPVIAAVAVIVVSGGHLAGAIRVLCGRSRGVLVVTALPLVGAAVVHGLVIQAGGVFQTLSAAAVLPLVMGGAAVLAAMLAPARHGRAGGERRRPGALVLPEEAWWP